MRQLLPATFLCVLCTCSSSPGQTPETTLSEELSGNDWEVWVSHLEAAVGWPRASKDVIDVSFPTKASTLRNNSLPKAGHQAWLDCPATVASVDLSNFCREGGDWYLARSAPFFQGEAMVLRHYRGEAFLHYPVHALMFRNEYGRCFTARAQVSLRPARVEDIVADLGRQIGPDNNRLMAALHAEPHKSARLLVRELQVIDPVKFPPLAWHVIWCIRTLESLTDQEFEFMISEALTTEQEEFLNPTRPMNYYAAWMSRSRFYLAPRGVQQKVIDAWKAWVATQGEDFTPAKEPRAYAP